MSDIDFGQLSEALNDKSDRDLRNVDTTAKADAVIDYQEPTADNGYTWYRKYASGWCEQGGVTSTTTDTTVNLPVEMADTNYSIIATSYKADAGSSNASNNGLTVGQRTTTTFYIVLQEQRAYFWQVSGMAA